MKRIQFYLTPSEGKILIGKAIATLPDILNAMKEHTVVVIAGTTNAPVAYELLRLINHADQFSHHHFFRGMTVPPGTNLKSEFTGDVIIKNGQWLYGKTIFDVENELGKDDIILKGANAVHLGDREAAVLLGHPKAGTSLPILSAVYGRRAKLYVPVGCEKRVDQKLSVLANMVNDKDTKGLRLLPLPGEIFTELDAIAALTHAKALIIGGGGVLGAEGGVYYMAQGTDEELDLLQSIIKTIKEENIFW